MSRSSRLVLVVVAMVVAAAVGGLGAYAWSGEDGSADSGATSEPDDPSAVAQTSFPDLAAPTGEPTLAGLDTAAPRAGSVVVVAGPFDDRFTLSDLTVADGVVTGSLTVTSDVSEILELQVLAGFYDDHGALLGTGREVFHLDEEEGHAHQGETAGPPNETEHFRIRAPKAAAAEVASAAVGVPVLVNE